MKFCSACGADVRLRVPDGDDRERHVCDACGEIHYRNPRIVAGCLVWHGDQVLLCRRAIEPRRGWWTLPAGFMELGESTEEGALRETWEEALARPESHGLYTLFNLPHISQVYMFYRAELAAPDFGCGPESLDAALFHEHEIPWDDLAFPVVKRTLEHWFSDRRSGTYPVRTEDIRFERLRR